MGFHKTVTTAAVAVAMMVVPALAQAASPANRLSVSAASQAALADARVGSSRNGESNLSGGSLILAIVAAAAVIAGIVVAVDGGNDNEGPVSP